VTPALIVSDVSGTIIENHTGVSDAFRQALAEAGVELTNEDIARVRGASKRAAIRSLLGERPGGAQQCDAVYERFERALLDAYVERPPEAIAGAVAVLERCRSSGMQVALTTGFDRRIALRILDRAGWPAGAYDALVCGDDVPLGRPAPYQIFRAMELTETMDVTDVLAVGDTVNDLLAASYARVGWNVGVLTGAHDRETLARAPHTHLVDSVVDLPAIALPR
jgi:phosphonatase-like hydrolase